MESYVRAHSGGEAVTPRKMFHRSLGLFLRDAREAAGLNQTEVGKVLGVQPQFVSNWERGMSTIPLGLVRQVTILYGMHREHFIEKYLEFRETQLCAELGLRRVVKRADRSTINKEIQP